MLLIWVVQQSTLIVNSLYEQNGKIKPQQAGKHVEHLFEKSCLISPQQERMVWQLVIQSEIR